MGRQMGGGGGTLERLSATRPLGEDPRGQVVVAREHLGGVGVEAEGHHHGHHGGRELGVRQHGVGLVLLLLCLLGGGGGTPTPLLFLDGLLVLHLRRPHAHQSLWDQGALLPVMRIRGKVQAVNTCNSITSSNSRRLRRWDPGRGQRQLLS